MCDATTIMLAGSAVMSGIGQAGGGRAAKAEAAAQAGMEESNARLDAAAIRRAGERQHGSTLAAIAASGVKVGEGSALDAERQVREDVARDEYITILTGKRRADALRRGGADAARAGNVGAYGSLLQFGAGYARSSGWRSNGPGFSGTQAPAPVSDRSWRSGGGGSQSGIGWMDY